MGIHQVYPSVEAMLEPPALGVVLGRPVRWVARRPMETKGWGSTEPLFESVLIDGEPAPSLIVKQMYQSTDYEAIAVDVAFDRQVLIWESGVLDRLPAAIGHAVVAAARFDGGSALLMRNLDAYFLPEHTDISPERATGVLRSIAALHAAFWQDPPIEDLGHGLCGLDRWVSQLGPAVLADLGRALPKMDVLVAISDGWARLPAMVDPGVVRDLHALADDPTPVVAALSDYPSTLLHGDVRIANVAWDGTRAILVDWKPIVGPPGIDLVYFVLHMDEFSPFHPDGAAITYRMFLEDALGDGGSWSWWDDHLDVCFAAGLVAMTGVKAWGQERYDPGRHPDWVEMRWWADRARRGLRIIERA